MNPKSPAMPFEVKDKETNLQQGLNPNPISLQYFHAPVLSYSTYTDTSVRSGRTVEARTTGGDGPPNAAESLAFAGKFADLLLELGCFGYQRPKCSDHRAMLLTVNPVSRLGPTSRYLRLDQ